MQRYTKKSYRRHMWVLMAIYVALIFFEWPQAGRATYLPWKIVLAIVPALPVIAVICLMAKLVMHSDELEQRLYLSALSVATGVVAIASMVGGFLCSAGVFKLDGDILIWVFPALCMTYGVAHVLFARRYGGMGCG
jgi:hypothetical protein